MTNAQLLLAVPDSRAQAAWKALPWALYTRCQRCGALAYCRGRRRASVVCFDCFASRPRGRRARRGEGA
jgi:hypothetical protein